MDWRLSITQDAYWPRFKQKPYRTTNPLINVQWNRQPSNQSQTVDREKWFGKEKEKKPVDNRQTRTTPVRCMAASVCKWAETRWLLMGQHALERGKLGNMLIFMDGIASQGVWGSISLLLTHSIAFLFFSPRPGHDVPTTRHYPHFRAWRPTTCSRKKNELRPATLMHEKKFGANSFSFSLKLLRWPCPRRNKTRRLSPTQKRTTYRSIYRVSLSVSHSESDKTWMISCIGMLHCRKKTFHVWSVFPLFSLSLSLERKEGRTFAGESSAAQLMSLFDDGEPPI